MKKSEFKLSSSQVSWLSKLAEPLVRVAFSKEQAATVQFDDGSMVELTSEGIDVAPHFECFRLDVALKQGKVNGEPPHAFVNGAMKINILQSEEWFVSEKRPDSIRGLVGNPVGNHHIGIPGSAPPFAERSCILDSGILLTAPTGERLIIRCDVMPCWLTITDDEDSIERDLEKYRVTTLV